MTAPIARSSLTTQLVAHLVDALETSNVLVGRGTAPKDGGWTSGQPGIGTFAPYITVKTRPATPWLRDEVGRNRSSWQCNYAITSSHYKDSACDDVADLARAAVVSFGADAPLSLGGVMWSLQKVDVPRLGATGPRNSTNPPFWEVTDDVSLWLSAVRTP